MCKFLVYASHGSVVKINNISSALLNLFCFIFSVIYFLFIMIACVLSLATSTCVMYIYARADHVPMIAMPAWVSVWVVMVALGGRGAPGQ